MEGFLTPLSLLIPAFSLEHAPQRFTPLLHSKFDAPLPLRLKDAILSFGSGLEPRYIVRARPLDQ